MTTEQWQAALQTQAAWLSYYQHRVETDNWLIATLVAGFIVMLIVAVAALIQRDRLQAQLDHRSQQFRDFRQIHDAGVHGRQHIHDIADESIAAMDRMARRAR
jgi:hypothetical protein